MKKFEELTRSEQLEALCRLHDTLNDSLFGGELNRPYIPKIGPVPANGVEIWIGRAGTGIDFNAYASFYGSDITGEEVMTFDFDYLSYLIPDYEPDAQIKDLATVTLHEMNHQYQFENGLPMGHGGKFRQFCKAHGLQRSTVLNGDGNKETIDSLLPAAEQAIKDFQW